MVTRARLVNEFELARAIARPPLVKRRIADAVPAAKMARPRSGSVFLQHLDDLFFRDPAFTHRLSTRWRAGPSLKIGGVSGEQVRSYSVYR